MHKILRPNLIILFLLSACLTLPAQIKEPEKKTSEINNKVTIIDNKIALIEQQLQNLEELSQRINKQEQKQSSMEQQTSNNEQRVTVTEQRIDINDQKILNFEQRIKELNNAISDVNTKLTEISLIVNGLSIKSDNNTLEIKETQKQQKNQLQGANTEKAGIDIKIMETEILLIKKTLSQLQEKFSVETSTIPAVQAEETGTEKHKLLIDRISGGFKYLSESKWTAPVSLLIAIIALIT